jgi:hypothetical protein
MASYNDAVTLLQTWVRGVSGQQCFVLNDMGPAPAVPYCTVHVSRFVPVQHDTKTRTDTTETIRGLARLDVAVSAWGAGAEATASRVKNSIFSDARYLDLWTLFGKSGSGEIQDLSSEFRSKIRPGAEFMLSLYAALSDTFNAGYFDHTDITIDSEHGELDSFTIGVNDPPESQQPCNFILPGA